MKILLSVFSCAPNVGSEAGGGWKYAMGLAGIGHEVWAITDVSRREAILSAAESIPENLHIIYYRPCWLKSVRLNSKTAHLVYQGWQMGVWRLAQALDAQHDFDVCWHLTYGVFRQPSWIWRVGKPFVFGPVGGAESAPVGLWKGLPLTEKLRELMRATANRFAWAMPGLRATYRNADLLIARTQETYAAFPKWAQRKAHIQQEIGGYPARVTSASRTRHAGYLKVLFAGRLLGWKGAHLAILAFSGFLAQGGTGELTLIGEGPMDAELKRLAKTVDGKITFVGRLPQQDLFHLYQAFDVFLFPSLHDSGGNVVVESLSFGLPVVCLDLGGPCCFVDDSCGLVVSTENAGTQAVVEGLAHALLRLQGDPEFHFQLCEGAIRRANEMTWEKQMTRVMALVLECAGKQ